MKPLSAEIKALAEVLHTPLEDFLSERERNEHKDPEGLAQKRMFTKAIEAADEARGQRTSYMVLIRSVVGWTAFGPYGTNAQAEKAYYDTICSTFEHTMSAVVPIRNHGGLTRAIAELDMPVVKKSDSAEVARDAAAFKRGWGGKAAQRQKYLEDVG